MKTWIDTFLSVPIIGIQVVPKLSLIHNYQNYTSKYFDELIDSKDVVISIGSSNNISDGYKVEDSDGYYFLFKKSHINVAYQYHPTNSKNPGQLNSFEWPEIKPYSHLLMESRNRLSKILNVLIDNTKIDVIAIGIVAQAWIPYDEAPPGIVELIDNCGKTWNTELERSNLFMMVKLDEDPSAIERCSHSLSFDLTDDSNELRISLDWQKVFSEKLNITSKFIDVDIKEYEEKALNYFEKLAIGDFQ